LALVLEVPVFRAKRVLPAPGVVALWAIVAVEICTLAELVNDPNRPNTKPATAIAAMRVMAIRITVARTGEIAFLRLALLIFNVVLLLYENCPENGTCPPLDRKRMPVKASPDVPATHVPAAVTGTGIEPAPAVTVVTVIVGVQVTPP